MKTIISLAAVLSIFWGGYFYIENRYAHCEDVKQIEKRLDYKIVSDQAQYKQQRIWQLSDRYPDQNKMPATVKEEFRQLQTEKAVLEKKLEALEKK